MSSPSLMSKMDRVEAIRHVTQVREDRESFEMEEGMSINDWVDQIKVAAKSAHAAARANAWMEQFTAWGEISAIAVGRMEQLIRYDRQASCDHEFGVRPQPATRCGLCDLMYGDQ